MASPSTIAKLKETLKAKYGTLVDNTYLTELINDNVNNEANATDENLFDTLIQSYLAEKSNQTIDNFTNKNPYKHDDKKDEITNRYLDYVGQIALTRDILKPSKNLSMRPLLNLGNTCYMNSILQCLTFTEPFTEYLLDYEKVKAQVQKASTFDHTFTKRDTHELVENGYKGELLLVWASFVKAYRDSPENTILSPQILREIFTRIPVNNYFEDNMQQDSHDFLMQFVNGLDSDTWKSDFSKKTMDVRQNVIIPTNIDNTNYYISKTVLNTKNDTLDKISILQNIMGGLTLEALDCKKCNNINRAVVSSFAHFQIPIKGDTLELSLDDYVKPEKSTINNKYKCPNCGNDSDVTKQITIAYLPEIVSISIKRYNSNGERISTPITFPMELDMAPYLTIPTDNKLIYDLYAYSIHLGDTLKGGHYTSKVKNFDDEWYYMNDSQEPTKLNKNEIIDNEDKKNAYILFYKQTGGGTKQQLENLEKFKKLGDKVEGMSKVQTTQQQPQQPQQQVSPLVSPESPKQSAQLKSIKDRLIILSTAPVTPKPVDVLDRIINMYKKNISEIDNTKPEVGQNTQYDIYREYFARVCCMAMNSSSLPADTYTTADTLEKFNTETIGLYKAYIGSTVDSHYKPVIQENLLQLLEEFEGFETQQQYINNTNINDKLSHVRTLKQLSGNTDNDWIKNGYPLSSYTNYLFCFTHGDLDIFRFLPDLKGYLDNKKNAADKEAADKAAADKAAADKAAADKAAAEKEAADKAAADKAAAEKEAADKAAADKEAADKAAADKAAADKAAADKAAADKEAADKAAADKAAADKVAADKAAADKAAADKAGSSAIPSCPENQEWRESKAGKGDFACRPKLKGLITRSQGVTHRGLATAGLSGTSTGVGSSTKTLAQGHQGKVLQTKRGGTKRKSRK
jgi:ubiquitin C-terminal hydrolase